MWLIDKTPSIWGTDSTVFSNFWMFIPGKPELMLGCTDWLNRRNACAALPLVFATLGLLLAAAGAWSWRRPWPEAVPMLLAACAVGVFAGVGLVGAANRAAYPTPAPHTRYPTICFGRQWSHFELPDRTLFHEPSRDFSTLYVWVQRVGFVPRVCAKLSDSVRQDDGIVMINPSGSPSQSDLRRLRRFVEQGGSCSFSIHPQTNGRSPTRSWECSVWPWPRRCLRANPSPTPRANSWPPAKTPGSPSEEQVCCLLTGESRCSP